MEDPVTQCRGSLWVFPCEKIRAVLRLLIISNKFVRQSRHIGTLTKMVFVVWVGFSPHLLQDLFVFKASLATSKRTTVCPTTKVISDRQGKLFSFTFVGISTYFISDPRRSLSMQCDCKYLWAIKERRRGPDVGNSSSEPPTKSS